MTTAAVTTPVTTMPAAAVTTMPAAAVASAAVPAAATMTATPATEVPATEAPAHDRPGAEAASDDIVSSAAGEEAGRQVEAVQEGTPAQVEAGSAPAIAVEAVGLPAVEMAPRAADEAAAHHGADIPALVDDDADAAPEAAATAMPATAMPAATCVSAAVATARVPAAAVPPAAVPTTTMMPAAAMRRGSRHRQGGARQRRWLKDGDGGRLDHGRERQRRRGDRSGDEGSEHEHRIVLLFASITVGLDG